MQADDGALLFEQYAPVVYRVCRRRTASQEEAEDAVQETFQRLLEADRSVIADPQKWLIAVAIRVCARSIQGPRMQRNEHEAPLADERLGDFGVDPQEPALDAAWLAALAKRLRPVDFTVLHWLYVTGLSLDQVAERLNVSVGNVRIMAFRARNRLRELHDAFGIGLDLMLFFNPLTLALLGGDAWLPPRPCKAQRLKRPTVGGCSPSKTPLRSRRRVVRISSIHSSPSQQLDSPSSP